MTPLNKDIQCLYSHVPIKLSDKAGDQQTVNIP